LTQIVFWSLRVWSGAVGVGGVDVVEWNH